MHLLKKAFTTNREMFLENIYLFKVNNRNTRKIRNMFKVENKDSRTMPFDVALLSLLLTLNILNLFLVSLLLTSDM